MKNRDEDEEQGLPEAEERTMLPPELGEQLPAKEPEQKAEEKSEEAPQQPQEQQITVDAYVRRALSSKDPIVIAFVSEEKRTNSVRKLGESDWRKLYDAFRTAPR